MATRTDRLFWELDRQLAEVRVLGEGVAARAGVLTSSMAVAAGLLGSRFGSATGPYPLFPVIALAVALLLGVLVLSPAMIVGPTTVELALWTDPDRLLITSDMYASKLIALEANRSRLRVMRLVFDAQLVVAVFALVSALAAMRGARLR